MEWASACWGQGVLPVWGGEEGRLPRSRFRVGGHAGQEEQGRSGVVPAGLLHIVHCGVLVFAVHGALEVVDDALERQSPEALLEALHDPALALRGVRRDFADWYLEQLSSDREQKAQVS